MVSPFQVPPQSRHDLPTYLVLKSSRKWAKEAEERQSDRATEDFKAIAKGSLRPRFSRASDIKVDTSVGKETVSRTT